MVGGSTRSYRCTLVRVLPNAECEVAVVARRSFNYAGQRYRRGETAVVSGRALSYLLLSRKVIWVNDGNGTAIGRSVGGLVPQVSMAGTSE